MSPFLRRIVPVTGLAIAGLAAIGLAMTLRGAAAQDKPPHNVILFVPDGDRKSVV